MFQEIKIFTFLRTKIFLLENLDDAAYTVFTTLFSIEPKHLRFAIVFETNQKRSKNLNFAFPRAMNFSFTNLGVAASIGEL